jgi:hypothetical protein
LNRRLGVRPMSSSREVVLGLNAER